MLRVNIIHRKGRTGLRFKIRLWQALSTWLFFFAGAITSAHGENITYCVDPDWPPYEAIKDGSHVGISADYMTLLANKTGFTFTLLPTSSWEHTLAVLASGECMLSPFLNHSDERAQYLAFSDIYFRSPNVLVSLREQPFLQSFENIGERTLAIPAGYRLMEYVRDFYPQTQVVEVASELDGLVAVAAGKADLFVGSLYSINNLIYQQSLYQMKVAGWVGVEDELRIGVSLKHRDLLPVINDALRNISDAEHIAIYKKWTQIDVIDVVSYQRLQQGAIAALVIILLLAAWNYRRRYFYQQLKEEHRLLEKTRAELEHAVEQLAFLSDHDALTQVHNRHYFDRVLQAHNALDDNPSPTSLVILDIDHFKHINDTHGHSVGDGVLKALAEVLRHCVRDHDSITRWGGEEFVILCERLTAPQALALTERIAQRIQSQVFTQDIRLTCSFGIAQLQPQESMEQCFERADNALFQAKQAGRNCIMVAD